METTCTLCNTRYRISSRELEEASGQVICSVCLSQFDANINLQKNALGDDIIERSTEEKFEKIAQQRQHSPTRIYSIIIVLSLVTLIAQVVFFNQKTLLQNPTTRTIAEAICSAVSCELPSYKNAALIQLINRKVHSHPVEKSSLIITATVINNAPQAQPFPKVLISMADIQGNIKAQRLFEPAEYLPDNLYADQAMAASIPLNINLEIVDPGHDLIAFEIDFL